ncbi:O-linked N-acetylglucosamine transferase, SPINDLY family protein [Derxia lacustris]|uniref:O-linked N-acetylglucosamine transferase, SPINDLY family protein n=1 Tax=Derxia lacustris TaxID=764842 RepID=UPI000A16F546|nr:UDP-N-acetylglucosamine-peptide N-acetylglucosaminyltransferase [Derxia lacustris]
MKQHDRNQRMCDWTELGASLDHARASLVAGDLRQIPPFLLLSMEGISAAEQRRGAELWMHQRVADAQPLRDSLRFAHDLADRPRLRIGYLSADFQQHATALLLIESLEAHDRGRFELFAYSYGADSVDGAMRQRVARAVEHFTDISALDDAAAATRIHADGIDILVDLKGYTHATRTAILLLGAAPVQVNFLGYPGTLGLACCDYLITDAFLTPDGSAADYSEALAYLPHSYQPHARYRTPDAAPTRAQAGLPASGVVFCCFNQAYKITPAVFSVWCQLLLMVDDSVLWLLADPAAEANLRNAAFGLGIAADRLVFAPDCPQPEHLARLALADIVLDTAPYNAHTTASDALGAGVPLVTCAGATFASRVAGSLLNAVGLGELITDNLDDYFELALALATDPARLIETRARLVAAGPTAPLFNVAKYTRDLEALYEGMWARKQAGLPPAPLGAVPLAAEALLLPAIAPIDIGPVPVAAPLAARIASATAR